MGDPLAQYHSEYHAHLYHLAALDSGVIADWHIERVLGHGGYGAVARARRSSGDVGALKLTHPDICQKEVEILRRFGGESIPRLLDGPVDLPELGYEASCYVMELADETLAQHFEGPPVPDVCWCSVADDDFYREVYAWIPYERRERDALGVASTVLVALETANSHVHGDVCPSNVLLFSSGTTLLRAKLADWGNARAYLRGTVDYTLIGGKELWCPPRTRAQTSGLPGATFEPPTDKTDIYGLGALVCWMLTGTVPDQIARWGVRENISDQQGLPMERVDSAWHEFLVATTRADRERRADHKEVTQLLADVRSRLRLYRPIVEPTHPVGPLPDPHDQDLRSAATSNLRSAPSSSPDADKALVSDDNAIRMFRARPSLVGRLWRRLKSPYGAAAGVAGVVLVVVAVIGSTGLTGLTDRFSTDPTQPPSTRTWPAKVTNTWSNDLNRYIGAYTYKSPLGVERG